MKKWLGLLVVVVLLAACGGNDAGNEVEAEEANDVNEDNLTENNDEVEEEPAHVNEGKETLSLDDIQDEMIYSWDLAGELSIYLVREDGEDDVYDMDSALGVKGDAYFEGDVSFYLVYDGDDLGYLQATVEDVHLDLTGRKLDAVRIGESDFLGWTKSEASVINSLYLFLVQDEELEQVALNNDLSEPDIVTATQIKGIDDQYIQSFTYANAGEEIGYHFFTYEWNPADKTFSEMKEATYLAGSDFVDQLVSDWYDSHIYPAFGQYRIDEKTEDELKKGYLFTDEIKLGDRLVTIENDDSFNLRKSFNRGAETYIVNYQYEIFREGYDFDGTIKNIIYFSNMIDQSYSEIVDVLGEPESNDYMEMDDAYLAKYIYGPHVLEIMHNHDHVFVLELRDKNEYD